MNCGMSLINSFPGGCKRQEPTVKGTFNSRDMIIWKGCCWVIGLSTFFTLSSFKTTHWIDEGLKPVSADSIPHRNAALRIMLDSVWLMKDGPGFSREETTFMNRNGKVIDSFLLAKKDSAAGTCREKECVIYAEIDKSDQLLYLYLLGELTDTFPVSTGKGDEYETPALELHPEGPLLIKHTSKKFPGGNYKGMGNMPYSVFLTNGYAIHGTTAGNFRKLGNRASHGCIRLHPGKAKYFFALVKMTGIKQTWVSIKDSLP